MEWPSTANQLLASTIISYAFLQAFSILLCILVDLRPQIVVWSQGSSTQAKRGVGRMTQDANPKEPTEPKDVGTKQDEGKGGLEHKKESSKDGEGT